jgi:hypothetical protein
MPAPTDRLAELHTLAEHPGPAEGCPRCAAAEAARLGANRRGRRALARNRASVDRLIGGDAA